MKNFPATATPEKTTTFIVRMQEVYSEKGFCYFAIDSLQDNQFIGFIGLCHQEYDVAFSPFIDIGLRLDKKYWGKGFAFNVLDLDNIKSTAPLIKISSINVMEKIGMEKLLEFKHPKLLNKERLVNSLCYEIKNP